MMKSAVIFLLFICTFLNSAFAKNNLNQPSKALEQNFSQQFLIGSSDLKFLGFEVYQISLWSEKPDFSYEKKFAIQICYNMSFSKEDLVQRSIEEIKRLHHLADSEESLYRAELNKSLRSVKKGDIKNAVFTPAKGVEIFLNNISIGKINDKKLARLFIDIWLDEKGSYPEVTRKILGKV